MRKLSMVATVVLAVLPGRASADVPVQGVADGAAPKVSQAVYYETPAPRYGWQYRRPWAGEQYRNWAPGTPYAYAAPRYPSYQGYQGYRGYQPYRSYGAPAYRYDWPSDRNAHRLLQPPQPGYWSRTPSYRWADNGLQSWRVTPWNNRGAYQQQWRW